MTHDPIQPEEVPGIRKALAFYRVMAWIVGILLVVLMCVGLPLKYIGGDDRVVTWTGVPHGWLYAALLIAAYNLGRRARWGWGRLLLIALAGTVPFLTFVAEWWATRDVKRTIQAVENKASSL